MTCHSRNTWFIRLVMSGICLDVCFGCSKVSDADAVDRLIALERDKRSKVSAIYRDYDESLYFTHDEAEHEKLHKLLGRYMAEASLVFDKAAKECRSITISDDLEPVRDAFVFAAETEARNGRRTSERMLANDMPRMIELHDDGHRFSLEAEKRVSKQIDELAKRKPELRNKLEELRKEWAAGWLLGGELSEDPHVFH